MFHDFPILFLYVCRMGIHDAYLSASIINFFMSGLTGLSSDLPMGIDPSIVYPPVNEHSHGKWHIYFDDLASKNGDFP